MSDKKRACFRVSKAAQESKKKYTENTAKLSKNEIREKKETNQISSYKMNWKNLRYWFFFIFFSGECWGGTLKVFKARTREKKIESNIILVRKNQKRKKNLNHRNTQIVTLDIHTKINKQKKTEIDFILCRILMIGR